MKMADKINDEKYKAVMAEEEKAERELAEYEALQKRISRDADIQDQGSSSSGPYPVPGQAVNMAPADPDDAFFCRKSPILPQVWATFEATQNATTPKAVQAPPLSEKLRPFKKHKLRPSPASTVDVDVE